MTQLLGHSAQQELQEAGAHPAVPSALPGVEDTIFPGQPKHAPSCLRGKGMLGGTVGPEAGTCGWGGQERTGESRPGEAFRQLQETGTVLAAGRD